MKQQIEELAATRADFPELITGAQHWLLARETSFPAAGTLAGKRRENQLMF